MNKPTNTPGPAHLAAGAERIGDAMPLLANLPAAFKERAAIVREYAADERGAAIWELAAEVAERAIRQSGLERLTLPQAAQESGYSVDHLRRLIDEGTIPNASEADGSKSILRMHLPRKPGHGVAPVHPTPSFSKTETSNHAAAL